MAEKQADEPKENQSDIQGIGSVLLSATVDENERELTEEKQQEVEDGIQGRGIAILSSTEETPKL